MVRVGFVECISLANGYVNCLGFTNVSHTWVIRLSVMTHEIVQKWVRDHVQNSV